MAEDTPKDPNAEEPTSGNDTTGYEEPSNDTTTPTPKEGPGDDPATDPPPTGGGAIGGLGGG